MQLCQRSRQQCAHRTENAPLRSAEDVAAASCAWLYQFFETEGAMAAKSGDRIVLLLRHTLLDCVLLSILRLCGSGVRLSRDGTRDHNGRLYQRALV